ncbi:hypothetical protein [Arthrobacter sp. zg-Y877]|uniref:DUF6993 domain-containing protein n=1 Tax=Arthrobacter sp. zg-Y877 TaxID=3049074 RepID=UPI0025A456A4|nr:hypothetical protein [Arthrobacter sp. zg-Y877]MDM7989536.1 hypothetical protein [Arthrobacter sp. zg-Y877]
MALAVVLAGCIMTGEGAGEDKVAAPAGSAATEPAPPRAAESSPTPVETLESELGKLAASDPSPDRQAMADAFAAAGFPAASVEVSADRTPTGLEVDSIQAAALQGGECVFGEVRDGAATVTVLPPLSDGGCFVGN